MKVLAGDWPTGFKALVSKKGLSLHRSTFRFDDLAFSEIESFEIVTEENHASIAGKLGWGAVGLVALGPLGLLAGVLGGGNKKERVMSVVFKDGRKVLLKGTAKDAEALAAATF
jgi:hypothetical protein